MRRFTAKAVAPRVPEHGEAVDVARLLEVLGAVGIHYFVGQLLSDGSYQELLTGPGVEALLGGPVPPGLSATRAWTAAVHPDDWQRYLDGHRQVAVGLPVTMDYRLTGQDGRLRWVRDAMWPRRREMGGSMLVDGVVVDVTAEHESNEVAERSWAEADEANRRLIEMAAGLGRGLSAGQADIAAVREHASRPRGWSLLRAAHRRHPA